MRRLDTTDRTTLFKRGFLVFMFLVLLILSGCKIEGAGGGVTKPEKLEAEEIDRVRLRKDLFIQGLEVSPGGDLIAGLGLYTDSRVVSIDPDTGKAHSLGWGSWLFNYYFGEGISFGPHGNLYQLTWKEGKLFVRDPRGFSIKETLRYSGEGWGLAYNSWENVFYLSDGSDKISVRKASNFEEIHAFHLKENNLNELEYVNGYLYANVWKEDYIVKIDVKKEAIVGTYDLHFIAKHEGKDTEDVLNGIAHIQDDLFYISGKNWRHLYTVRLK